jgi:integrase
MPRVKKLKEENARQGFLSPADLAALLKELPEYLADFTRYAYLTGWRRGEVSSLTWADVDIDGRTARLRPENSKNSEGRVIPLEGDLLALIQKRYLARVVTSRNGEARIASHVFHRQGEPVSDFRLAWESAIEKANLPGLLFHDLRRSAVMNMRRAGVSEGVIMQFTGHRTRNVFERYNIKTLDDLREAQAKTARYLEAAPAERKIETLPQAKPA